MVRVKRAQISKKKKKKILKAVKGFKWGRKSRYRLAKEALMHALMHAYVDRRRKKREFRRLWQVKINAAVRALGLSYSRFIHALKQNKIELSRKILATLAEKKPEIFKKIVEKVKPKEKET